MPHGITKENIVDSETISFTMLYDEQKPYGFSLTASGEHDAEAFCRSFPHVVTDKRASINVHYGKVIFNHPGYSSENPLTDSAGGVFSAPISEEDGVALMQMLAHEGSYAGTSPKCRFTHGFAKGFELRFTR